MLWKEFNINEEFKSQLKLKLSAISGAFMLPVATMAVVQIFLSIAGILTDGQVKNSFEMRLGEALRSLSVPILQAFPILLCVSFTIAFNKKKIGIAIWCSLLAFLTFIYFQSAFISFENNSNNCSQNGAYCSHITDKSCGCLFCHTANLQPTIAFNTEGRNKPWLIHRILGITTVNTSVFGPIYIGGVLIPYIIKNHSNIKLPTYLSYFSGNRLLPLISCLYVIPVGLFSVIFWPWISYALSWLGNIITKSYGVDSFFFGFIQKLLIPTGLHHILNSLFWYSPLGGDVSQALINGSDCTQNCSSSCSSSQLNSGIALSQALSLSSYNSLPLQGDALIGASFLSLPSNEFKDICQLVKNGNSNGKKVFEFFGGNGSGWGHDMQLKIGKFTQGKFPIMQFALPAAALAIYLSSKKRNETSKKSTFSGIWNSFILGITEPVEFSFMHKFPKLFWFHAAMCGVSFWTMNLLGAHIPTTFSGGFIELIVNGVIPYKKGTNFHWYAVVGSVLALIYFAVFYYVFCKYDQQSETGGINQNENKEQEESQLPPNIFYFKKGLGGWDNVINYKNCASRLRYDIKDKSKVNEESLKKAGVIAIKWIGNKHVQLIVGPKAEEINTNLMKYCQEELKVLSQ